MRGGQAARTFFPRWCAPARGGSVGEITTRRQTQPILCIVVEFVRVEVLFSSILAPCCEQIFPQGFCSGDFANSIRPSLGDETGGRGGRGFAGPPAPRNRGPKPFPRERIRATDFGKAPPAREGIGRAQRGA